MRLHRLLVSAAAVGVVALAAPALAQPDSQRPPTESERSRGDDSSTPPSTTAPSTPSQDSSGAGSDQGSQGSMSGSGSGGAQTGSFTDDQLKSFLKAHDDISHLKSMGTTPSNDQMAQAISRNGIDVPTYNAIGHALRGDQALQKRLASLRSASSNPG